MTLPIKCPPQHLLPQGQINLQYDYHLYTLRQNDIKITVIIIVDPFRLLINDSIMTSIVRLNKINLAIIL